MYFRLVEIATGRVLDISSQMSELEASMAMLCVKDGVAWDDRYNYFRIESPVE